MGETSASNPSTPTTKAPAPTSGVRITVPRPAKPTTQALRAPTPAPLPKIKPLPPVQSAAAPAEPSAVVSPPPAAVQVPALPPAESVAPPSEVQSAGAAAALAPAESIGTAETASAAKPPPVPAISALPQRPLTPLEAFVFAGSPLDPVLPPPTLANSAPPVPAVSDVIPRLDPVVFKSLSVPPSPVVQPLRFRRKRGPTAGGAVALVGVTAALVASGVGAAWAAVNVFRAPEAVPAPGVEFEAPPLERSPFVPSVHTVPAREGHETLRHVARTTTPAVSVSEGTMSARAPALPPPRRSSQPQASVGEPAAPVTEPAATTASSGLSCGEQCQGNIDCLLNCRPGASASGGVRSDNALIDVQPSREQVVMAMHNLRGAILVCGMGLPSTAPSIANVTVTFDSSGQATTASVGGLYAGTTTGACVARAAEHARVPPFQQTDFRVTYPFTVH